VLEPGGSELEYGRFNPSEEHVPCERDGN